jgi:hypothetical protein
MTQNGKSRLLFKEDKIAWTTKTSMGKSRQHLGVESTISSRGQITIPKRLMEKFDLRAGDTIRYQWASESPGSKSCGNNFQTGKANCCDSNHDSIKPPAQSMKRWKVQIVRQKHTEVVEHPRHAVREVASLQKAVVVSIRTIQFSR